MESIAYAETYIVDDQLTNLLDSINLNTRFLNDLTKYSILKSKIYKRTHPFLHDIYIFLQFYRKLFIHHHEILIKNRNSNIYILY
jgi:hypothetical protein